MAHIGPVAPSGLRESGQPQGVPPPPSQSAQPIGAISTAAGSVSIATPVADLSMAAAAHPMATETHAPSTGTGCNPPCHSPESCQGGTCKPPSGGCTPPCPAGQTCQNGTCIQARCTSDSQCPPGQVCTNGACAAPAGTPPPTTDPFLAQLFALLTQALSQGASPSGSSLPPPQYGGYPFSAYDLQAAGAPTSTSWIADHKGLALVIGAAVVAVLVFVARKGKARAKK